MTASNPVFTKAVKVIGGLHATFVFENQKDVDQWLTTRNKDGYARLDDVYGNLSFTQRNLDGLKIGDKCYAVGEGDEVFEIINMVKYSRHRYGFGLAGHGMEDVGKCYKSLT